MNLVQIQASDDADRLRSRLGLECRRLYLASARRSPAIGIFLTVVLAWFLAPSVGRTDVLIWGGFVSLTLLVRLFVLRWVSHQDAAFVNEPWISWFVCGTAVLMGLSSMYAILIWFPILRESERAMITMVCIAWLAAGISAQAACRTWIPFWAAPVVIGVVVAWIVVGGTAGWSIAALILIVTALLLSSLHDQARAIREAILMRLVNTELRQELTAQKGLVEQAGRAKTAFLVAASHDLRQPAMGIGLLISALQGASDLGTAKRIGVSAERALAAMERILQSLMEYSKLELGQVSVRKTPFNLHQVVRTLVEEVSASLEPGVIVQVDTRPAMIVSDQALFEQILRNLLANAARFTPTGTITVSTDSEIGSGAVTVRVIDTGVGIPEEMQQDIFKEYFQAATGPARRSKGMGLGLSIVEKAAHLLHARISVSSKIGEGSTFSVTIPAEVMATNNSTQRMEPTAYHNESKRLNGQSILIVDDDTLVRDSFQTVLETYGATVVVCGEADEAIRTLSSLGPSIRLAFIDYQISDEYSGIDLVETIRGQWPHVECVLVTGDVRKEVSEKAKALGIRVLYKPLRIQKLIEVIET